jgi:hypothetical protein
MVAAPVLPTLLLLLGAIGLLNEALAVQLALWTGVVQLFGWGIESRWAADAAEPGWRRYSAGLINGAFGLVIIVLEVLLHHWPPVAHRGGSFWPGARCSFPPPAQQPVQSARTERCSSRLPAHPIRRQLSRRVHVSRCGHAVTTTFPLARPSTMYWMAAGASLSG